jgi:Fe-S cluster assembly ATP-binding protein
MQYPTEVPGVHLDDVIREAYASRGRNTSTLDAEIVAEAARIHFDMALVERSMNVDLSGGEKKRNETLQLALLKPKFAILDELDSGLDIDALKVVSQGVNTLVQANAEMGVLVITHYQRLLNYIKPDVVSVMMEGRIVREGGPELALTLEERGYDFIREEVFGNGN